MPSARCVNEAPVRTLFLTAAAPASAPTENPVADRRIAVALPLLSVLITGAERSPTVAVEDWNHERITPDAAESNRNQKPTFTPPQSFAPRLAIEVDGVTILAARYGESPFVGTPFDGIDPASVSRTPLAQVALRRATWQEVQ